MNRCPSPWRRGAALAALLLAGATAQGQDLRLPLKDGSLRFAVIGDTGTAAQAQYDVGKQMAAFRARFPFDFVIMLGDNIYGSDSAGDFERKFELPYKALLDGGVKFYASLGNHDNPTQNAYKFFNMGRQRFYTFKPRAGVRFFAIDSNYMDKAQLDWLEKELAASGSDWKIPFFHHPLYSSGKKHGSFDDLRSQLEPLFKRYGVDVVFSGHDHFYERIKPQQGIYYFVCGAGGSLRKGDIDRRTGLTEVGFDTDYSFMIVEIDGSDMYFQAISRTGQTVDSGVIKQAAGRGVVKASPVPPGEPVAPAPVAPRPVAQPTPTPPPGAAPMDTTTPQVVATPKPSPSPSPSPTPRPPVRKRRPVKKPN
jgi:3',5'-cyclic AMP phosphodiesterase CpdA